MQMSESVALLRALRQISKGLERAEKIVGETLRNAKSDGKRRKRSSRLVLMKKR